MLKAVRIIKKFDEDLIERFTNTYRLCDDDVKKCYLMSRKSVYPYEHTDSWKKFNVTCSEKKFFTVT